MPNNIHDKFQYINCLHGWFSDNFCCIICFHFGISNFKIYPVYTSSFKYIFPDLIWIPTTHNLEYFPSFGHRFCTNLSMKCHNRHTLTKINWLSYLHRKTAKMFKRDSIKAIRRKRISWTGFTVIYNIHFKICRKKWRVRQFLHCDTHALISLILLLMH